MNMKVALYARVSTEKQEKQDTIGSQLEALRVYARDKGSSIIDEYVDEGYSGELLDRPGLDRLRDDAKKKIFEAVLVHSPDRLSRKYIYLGLVEEELKKSGIDIVYLNRPDAKNTPEDMLLNHVQGAIAEYEKAKTAERTRRGRLHKARKGSLVTSQAPYGYRYINGNRVKGVEGRYEMNEGEGKVVKLIFGLFVNKRLSIRAIARELTRLGIQPQRGRQWRTSSLHRILRNETYAGVTYYNKHLSIEPEKRRDETKYRRLKNTSRKLRPKDQWIPIPLSEDLVLVDRKTFERAQAQLITNSNMSPRNVKYHYLLRGLVRCGECGSPLNGCPCHGKLFYRCGNRGRTFPLPKSCKVSMVKADLLERVVWDKFCEAVSDPRLITQQIEKLEDRVSKRRVDASGSLIQVDKAMKVVGSEEGRLLDAYTGGAISLEQLKAQMVKIRVRQEDLEREKQGLLERQGTPTASVKKSIGEYLKQVKERLADLGDDFEGKRQLLTMALNVVLVEGSVVRIKGIIPVYPKELQAVSGSIASMSVGCCERNTTFEWELVASMP